MGSENNMVAVPEEPTEAMLEAGVEHLFGWADDDPRVDARAIWCAMIAATRLAQPDAQQGASSQASGEGVAIPAGMKPWPSDGEAPADWDKSAPIQDANGDIVMPRHTLRGMWHTVACYIPLAAATQPAVPQEVEKRAYYVAYAPLRSAQHALDIIARSRTGSAETRTLAREESARIEQAIASLTGAGEDGEQRA